MRSIAPRICLFLCIFLASVQHASAQTLTRVRASGTLRCATISEIPEYSSSDDHGPRTAFDKDLCRAVGVAILGPAARVEIRSYPDGLGASAALRAHKIDLIPTLTLDLTHSSDSRLIFSPPVLYDGVGFLARNTAAMGQPDRLGGQKICFLAATHIEIALRAWFAREHLAFVPFPFNEEGEMEAAFVTGNCAALAGDLTRLASVRLNFGPLASRYSFIPAENDPLQIAPDPLAAASLSSDPAFANIVRWTFEVLLNAEAAGLSRANRHGVSNADNQPNVALLTGQTREIGSHLHLANTWALNVVAAVGNYGEIFDRDLGFASPLKLSRAQNRLNQNGGLMLPVPLK